MMLRSALAILILAAPALAEDLSIRNAMVPLAPPGAMAHAAFMTLSNEGEAPVQLIGVSAEGYAMAHIHRTEVKADDVVTMSPVDVVEIAPGQSLVFEHGGLHIMLMRPEAPRSEGDMVRLTLEFADGSTQAVDARVMRTVHGTHGS